MEATFDLGFDFGDAFDEETNSILSAIDENELHERNDYDNTNNSIGSSTSKNTGTDTANLSRSDTTLPTTRSSTSKSKNRFATKSKEDLLEMIDHTESSATKANTRWATKVFTGK